MKKIISGKVYDTDTACLIGGHESDCGQGDFHWEDTYLYQTPKGAFFVQGTGGARSRWSQPCGSNGMSGGSGIQAMSAVDALEWCEHVGVDADVIALYFKVEEA